MTWLFFCCCFLLPLFLYSPPWLLVFFLVSIVGNLIKNFTKIRGPRHDSRYFYSKSLQWHLSSGNVLYHVSTIPYPISTLNPSCPHCNYLVDAAGSVTTPTVIEFIPKRISYVVGVKSLLLWFWVSVTRWTSSSVPIIHYLYPEQTEISCRSIRLFTQLFLFIFNPLSILYNNFSTSDSLFFFRDRRTTDWSQDNRTLKGVKSHFSGHRTLRRVRGC